MSHAPWIETAMKLARAAADTQWLMDGPPRPVGSSAPSEADWAALQAHLERQDQAVASRVSDAAIRDHQWRISDWHRAYQHGRDDMELASKRAPLSELRIHELYLQTRTVDVPIGYYVDDYRALQLARAVEEQHRITAKDKP